MKFQLSNLLLLLAATACFVESFHSIRDRNAEPLLTAVMGIFLLLKGLAAAPQRAIVIVSGCVLAALCVGSDEGLLNENSMWYMGSFILAGVGFAFWQRIKKFWE